MQNPKVNSPYAFADIESAACKFFNCTSRQLYSLKKDKEHVRRRWVVVHLSRLMTSRSLPDLARLMHFRDHTTVLYAQHRAQELIRDDMAFAHMVLGVAQMLFHEPTQREKFREIFAPPPPPPAPVAPAIPSYAAFASIGGAL